MAISMMGFWVTHPRLESGRKHPLIDGADRAFCFLLNSYNIDPGQLHAKDHVPTGFQTAGLDFPHLPLYRPAGGWTPSPTSPATGLSVATRAITR